MYLFLMVFPLNYELGEREENNLSVKFKLLINKTDMFEAAFPCLGKKKSNYTTHLRIINQFTHTIPEVTKCSIAPAVDAVLGIGARVAPEPEQDWLLGSQSPAVLAKMCLLTATTSLAFVAQRQDNQNRNALPKA